MFIAGAPHMSFLWPQSLWLLLLVPAFVAGYRSLLKAKRAAAARHPGLVPATRGFARHIPPALFVAAMVLLLTATARPTALLVMPSEARTVLLAIDVSGSMRADDVWPTRLAAAQAAARVFVNALPPSARIGVVAFSDEAELVQPPRADRDNVLNVIASLQPQHGTAIGRGILASLEAIDPDVPAAIIVLTDGQNSHGIDPTDAARLAAARGVRIYTVGVGTTYGHISHERGWRQVVGIDEDVLMGVAEMTGAEYFYASSAPELYAVYASLGSKVVLTRIRTEITALVCAVAALAAIVSAAMSLVWFGRVL
jgi:Ca-activated chloride channel homolog